MLARLDESEDAIRASARAAAARSFAPADVARAAAAVVRDVAGGRPG
jgi:hypothetical protein